LLKIASFVLSVHVSNDAVEGVFSMMKNIRTDERSRLQIKTVESELVRLNFKIVSGVSSVCHQRKAPFEGSN
jgi:hypothetical protein